MFLTWAAVYEGNTDQSYYDVLIPRILEEVILNFDGRLPVEIANYPAFRFGQYDRSVDAVAAEICEAADSFDLLFVHADTGGRGLAAGLADRRDVYSLRASNLCDFSLDRHVELSPKKETEAWALAECDALKSDLRTSKSCDELGIPPSPNLIESLVDPKATLRSAVEVALGKKFPADRVLPLIAQTQSISCLEYLASFREFKAGLVEGLARANFLR